MPFPPRFSWHPHKKDGWMKPTGNRVGVGTLFIAIIIIKIYKRKFGCVVVIW